MALDKNTQVERLLSWARYLYWADMQCERYISYEDNEKLKTTSEWQLFAVASLWLASMWVVIEGWRELKVNDGVIDELLNEWPDYCDLLKRYRNGVYHYQPALLDERFRAYEKEGADFILWVFALHLEFQRYLLEWPESIPATKEQAQEMREVIFEIIGWEPRKIIPVRKRLLQNSCEKALELLHSSERSGDKGDEEFLRSILKAQELLHTVENNPVLTYLRNKKKPNI